MPIHQAASQSKNLVKLADLSQHRSSRMNHFFTIAVTY